MKKLTVLVPCYNFSKYLPDCIRSIYKQKTNFNFDVIIRDDGSTDNTKYVLENLKIKFPNLIILDGTKNLGAFGNIKLLHESSNSEYIAYLDGDDMFGDEDKLQKQVDFLDSNPDHVMCFTGCRYLYEDGTIHPNDSRVICSVKDTITTEDLIDRNYVGFGKMFRNISNIFKEKYSNLPYVDWPMAYELSKYGIIKYNESFGGLYRISDDGIYSKLPEEEKVKGFNLVRNVIQKDYFQENYKTITIIDSYISNKSILLKLKKTISDLKKHNHKILLVSNTVPPEDVTKSVDYFLYNHENKLFNKKYENLGHVDLWKRYENLEIHEVSEELQKHGLSVLCNLFNSLDFAKSLGYTHFQRIEVDDLYHDEGYKFMNTVPELCFEKNKKGLFYTNQKDASFHFFYCEINFFISNFTRISNENDYIKYLKNFGYNNEFRSVEVYLLDHIRLHENSMILKNGVVDMDKDFHGTLWNTESSPATIDSKFQNCSTKIYNIQNSNGFAILSFNYTDQITKRKILVQLDNHTDTIYHSLEYYSSWVYNIYYDKLIKISVYDDENNQLLYELENNNVLDFIILK